MLSATNLIGTIVLSLMILAGTSNTTSSPSTVAISSPGVIEISVYE